jgi:hypothetical protein
MKLEKCVWCGSEAKILKNDDGENQFWDIDCTGCRFPLHGFDTRQEAESEWNSMKDTADSREFGKAKIVSA